MVGERGLADSMRPVFPPICHQVYFRTARGGLGIPYRNCIDEFAAVFGDRARVLDERTALFRAVVALQIDESEAARLARRLGYTLGLVRVTRHPLQGRVSERHMRHRWPVGWLREGDFELLFEEVFVADEGARLAESPHAFSFPYVDEPSGDVRPVRGRRVNRRLSPLDARFVASISGLQDGARVLDPFAGLCVLADALRRRALRVTVGDADRCLRVGLAERAGGRAIIAHAQRLPFADASFDGIVTEPPYHPDDRAAVVASVPEMARVLVPGGRVVLLVADFMLEALGPACRAAGMREVSRHSVPRHGLLSVCLTLERRGDEGAT